MQQVDVLVHPERHVGVHGGLALEQEEQVGAFAVGERRAAGGAAGLEPDAPDHVADAAVEVGADVLGIHLGEGGEVELAAPPGGEEAAHDVLDHAGLGEEELVGGVGGGGHAGHGGGSRVPAKAAGVPPFVRPEPDVARYRPGAVQEVDRVVWIRGAFWAWCVLTVGQRPSTSFMKVASGPENRGSAAQARGGDRWR